MMTHKLPKTTSKLNCKNSEEVWSGENQTAEDAGQSILTILTYCNIYSNTVIYCTAKVK